MKKDISRQSNLELLRILAMVLIIIHHIAYHVITKQLGNTTFNLYNYGEMFNNFMYYKRLTLVEYFLAFGKIGNFLFIIISGYFLIDKKNIDLFKPAKKLLTQLVYVIIVLLLASFIYSKFNSEFTGGIVFSDINGLWWFVGYYFVIVVIAKLFLNKYLNKFDNKEYLAFLAVLFVLCQFLFPRGIIDKALSSVLVYGIFVYSLGGYIKKYNPFNNIRSIVFVLLIILSFAIMTLSYRNQVQHDIANAIYNNQIVYYQSFVNYTEYSIIVFVIGLSCFELFRRLNIKNSKVINYVASTTFMIYLLHDNEFTHTITRGFNWIAPFHNDLLMFILMIIIKVIILFVAGAILYFIYSLLMKYLESDNFKKVIYRK